MEKKRYQLQFPPGAMGLEFEPVITSSERQIGCRVRDYYFGIDHDGISEDKLKAHVSIGDIVWYVAGENVLSSRFSDIIETLRSLKSQSRTVSFKTMQRTPLKADKENVLVSASFVSPAKGTTQTTSPRSYVLTKSETSTEAFPISSRLLEKVLSPSQTQTPASSVKKRKQNEESNKFVGFKFDSNAESTPQLLFSPKAVKSLSRLPAQESTQEAKDIISLEKVPADISLGRQRRRRARSVLPEISPDLLRLLSSMGGTIGSGLLDVGASVTVHAADAALAVGSVVGSQAERFLEQASEVVPRFSSTEVKDMMSKKFQLLNELSQMSVMLGAAEDMKSEYEKEAQTLRAKDYSWSDQVRLLEEKNALLVTQNKSLLHENEFVKTKLDNLLEESSLEKAEWQRINSDNSDRVSRLIAQLQAAEKSLSATKEDVEVLKESRRKDQLNREEAARRLAEENRAKVEALELTIQQHAVAMRAMENSRDTIAAELEVVRDLFQSDKLHADAELTRIKDNLSAQQEWHTQRLTERQNEIHEVKAQLSVANKQIREMTTKLEDSEFNNSRLKAEISHIEGIKMELIAELDSTKQRLRGSQDSLEEVLVEVEGLRANCTKDSILIGSMEETIIKQQSRINQLERDVEEKESSWTLSESHFQNQIVQLKQDHAAKIKSITTQLHQKELQYSTQAAEFDEKLYLADKEINEKSKLASEFKRRIQELEGIALDRQETMEDHTKGYLHRIEIGEKKIASQSNELVSLGVLVKRLNEDLERARSQGQEEALHLNSQLQQAAESLQQLQSKNVALEALHQSLLRDNARLKEVASECNADREKYHRMYRQLEEEKKKQLSNLCGLFRLCQSLRTEFAELSMEQRDLIDLHDAIKRTSAQSDEFNKRLLSCDNKEIVRLRSLLDDVHQDRSHALLRAENAEKNTIESEKRCVEAISQLSVCHERIETQKTALQEAQTREDTLRRQMVSLQSLLDQSQDEILGLTSRLETTDSDLKLIREESTRTRSRLEKGILVDKAVLKHCADSINQLTKVMELQNKDIMTKLHMDELMSTATERDSLENVSDGSMNLRGLQECIDVSYSLFRRLIQKCEQAEHEIKSLKTTESIQQSEQRQLRTELESHKILAAKLEADIHAIRIENERKMDTKMEESAMNIASDLAICKANLATAKLEVTVSQNARQELSAKLDQLQRASQELLMTKEADIDALKSEIDALRSEKTLSTQSLANENDALEQKVQELEATLSKMTSELHNKELLFIVEINSSKQIIGKLSEEISAQKKNLAMYEAHVQELDLTLKNKGSEMEEQAALLSEKIQMLKDEIDSLTHSIQKKDAEIESLQFACGSLRKQCEDMEESGKKRSLAELSELDGMKLKLDAVNEKHRESALRAETLRGELEEKKAELSRLHSENTSLSDRLEEITHLHSVTSEENRKLRSSVESILREKKSEIDSIRRRESELFSVLSTQTAALQEAELREKEFNAQRQKFEELICQTELECKQLLVKAMTAEKAAKDRNKELERDLSQTNEKLSATSLNLKRTLQSLDRKRSEFDSLARSMNELVENGLTPAKSRQGLSHAASDSPPSSGAIQSCASKTRIFHNRLLCLIDKLRDLHQSRQDVSTDWRIIFSICEGMNKTCAELSFMENQLSLRNFVMELMKSAWRQRKQMSGRRPLSLHASSTLSVLGHSIVDTSGDTEFWNLSSDGEDNS